MHPWARFCRQLGIALFATLNVTSLAFVAISIARIASASAAIKLIDQVRKLQISNAFWKRLDGSKCTKAISSKQKEDYRGSGSGR
jgi:hypothetical protein